MLKNSKSLSLFRNTGYNLFTQGLLILVSFLVLPSIVHGLGGERFALLSLLWAFVGYFSLLDFGISRAITKYLSGAIVRSDESLAGRIIWSALSLSLLFGGLSMCFIWGISPYVLMNIFKVNPLYYAESLRAFRYAAISIPFMLSFGTIRGIQMAYERFDLVNIFQGVMGLSQWLVSILLVKLGMGLGAILLLTAILRIMSAFSSFFLLHRLLPTIYKSIIIWDKKIIRQLLHFGSWLTVSQIISPLFSYLDRILVGAIISLTALAYYTVPQEALTRLLIVPVSFSTVLFPMFSGQSIFEENKSKLHEMYARSMKYMVLILLPVSVLIMVYARDILSIWMGTKYSEQGTIIFQIIAIGLFFNSIAQIPTTVLHAFGRPDLTAKFHLIELPMMVLMNLILISWAGIIGAALTWTFRVSIDVALLIWATHKFIGMRLTLSYFRVRFKNILILVLTSFFILATSFYTSILVLKIFIAGVFSLVFFLWAWHNNLDELDRQFILQLKNRIF